VAPTDPYSMETRNELFPGLPRGMNTTRSRQANPVQAGPLGLIRASRRRGLIRFLLCELGSIGVIVISIALDAALRPSPKVELAWQIGAFLAALFLSWHGLARFIPDLDRRWRARRRMF